MEAEVSISQFQQAMIAAGRPFASYRFPGAALPVTLYGPDRFTEIDTFGHVPSDKPGFVMAPYTAGAPLLWLEAQHSFEGFFAHADRLPDYTSDVLSWATPAVNPVGRSRYIDRVNQAIDRIRHGEAGKVVLSRQLIRSWPNAPLDAGRLFNYLCHNYPNTFAYLVFIPGQALWAGASPELLLEANNGMVATMSLSGTRKRTDSDTPWGQKEVEEHRWVTRFIADSIDSVGCTNSLQSDMHTAKAASVEHLRTQFSAHCNSNQIAPLVEALHPTPAVCGWPTPVARKIIEHLEEYDRDFYTGFLGPVNNPGDFRLFVNLRCMQINPMQALVYVGGGITADSVAEDEWEETVLKSHTMLGAIENLTNFEE